MPRQPPMFQHFATSRSFSACSWSRKWLGSHRCFSILATSRSLSAPSWSPLEPQMVLLAAPWLVPGCSWLPLAAPWLLLAAPWLLLAAPWLLLACFLAALGLLPGSLAAPGCPWPLLAAPWVLHCYSWHASWLLLALLRYIHTYKHTAHTTQTYMHAYIY